MIEWQELLIHNKEADIPPEHLANMRTLLERINLVRLAYGKPMIVTSCYRTLKQQKAIYERIGKYKVPLSSKHMVGAAVDILDRDGTLYSWTRARPDLLEKADLYCELGTHGWVHYQILPFGSYEPGGTRWFNP